MMKLSRVSHDETCTCGAIFDSVAVLLQRRTFGVNIKKKKKKGCLIRTWIKTAAEIILFVKYLLHNTLTETTFN